MPSRPRLAGEASPSRLPPPRLESTRLGDVPKLHWLARLLGRDEAERSPSPVGGSTSNPLLAFASETSAPENEISRRQTQPPARNRTWPTARWLLLAACCAVVPVVLVAGAFALQSIQWRFPAWHAAPQAATLTLATRPAGAEVSIDGQRRGDSPLTLSLSPGIHTMTLRRGRDQRTVPLTLAAGAEITQYLEFTSSDAPVAPVALGGISVVTDPPGARVKVDGEPHGTSPVVVTDLSAANHLVTVTGATGVAERFIAVEGGGTASVVFTLPKRAELSTPSAPLGGWLTVVAPFDLQVIERDDVVGASGTTKIMLPAGRHDVDLVSQSLEYRERRRIEIAPGKITAVRIEAPRAAISVNARPWADVSIDGNDVGQTPLANLAVPIGPHQVIFRHPQFGERRQTIVVTTKGPNRIAMDLSK
jgi:hypothetical protein